MFYLFVLLTLFILNHFVSVTLTKQATTLPLRILNFLILCATTASTIIIVKNIFVQPESHKLDQPNLIVYATAALGAISFCHLTFYLVKRCKEIAKQKSKFPPFVGATFFGSLVSVYLVIAVTDHLIFFRDKDNVGITNVQMLKDMQDTKEYVSDIKCDTGTIYIKKTENGYDYRCPKFAFGFIYSHYPFTPWPDYTSGSSANLGKAIEIVKATSRTINKDEVESIQ